MFLLNPGGDQLRKGPSLIDTSISDYVSKICSSYTKKHIIKHALIL